MRQFFTRRSTPLLLLAVLLVSACGGSYSGSGYSGSSSSGAAPSINSPSSLSALVAGGTSQSITFVAGGSTPTTWSISAGALPPGMTLNATTGVYSGIPTAVGSFSFTVTATNSVGANSRPYTQQVTAPAVNAHVLLSGNRIAAFATSFPAAMDTPMTLSGVIANDVIVAIDRRPQNGFLYGLGFNATAGTVQLYAIAEATGTAVAVGGAASFVAADGVTPAPVGIGVGTLFDIDFNPTVDRLRVVNSAGQNFRINPNTGGAVDGNATAPGMNMDGFINGATSSMQATAYTNSKPNSTITTQYAIDGGADILCIQNPPNAGTQTQCQTLSVALAEVRGFDIAPGVDATAANTPAAGIGLAAAKLAGQSNAALLSIDLSNGMVSTLGMFASGEVLSMALQQPLDRAFAGLSVDATQLLRFGSTTPGTATTVSITGIASGEALTGIDWRPQTGQLYGFAVNSTANNGTLYLLDPQTGAATAVGAIGQIAFVDAGGAPLLLPAATSGYGMDFNPTVDRIRIVQQGGLNFRLNPNTGAPVDGNATVAGVNADTSINSASGLIAGVSAAAYTNSVGQSLSGGVTTQYVLDAGGNQLLIQNPPNNGTVSVVQKVKLNGAELDFSEVNGFDIPSEVRVAMSGMPVTQGVGFAALGTNLAQHLYSIDLISGEVADLGVLMAPLSGLAVGRSVADSTAP